MWLNNGTGFFTDSGQALGTADSRGVSLGDLDGDGDLDAFVSNGVVGAGAFTANTVWWNDGTGVFTDSGLRLGSTKSYSSSLGDLDGDGDLDVIVGNETGLNEVWWNL